MKILKVAIRILCLFLVVGIVLTAVFFRPNSVNKISLNDEIIETSTDFVNSGELEKIASSGFIELYFNKTTSEIAVKETSENHMWYAMPDGYGSMASVCVVSEKGTYNLDSQHNSVADSDWEYQLKENGVDINYTVSKDDISCKVFLDITLKDGSLFVESSVENVSENENCAIKYLSVLPSFCSFSNPQNDDFLLIPDGCGAVIYPAQSNEKSAYEVQVYGDDYAVETTDRADAIMGAFGVKHQNSAIAVVIDSGEETAVLKAVSDKNSLSSVGAYFNINNCCEKDGNLYYGENAFDGKIALCYKFLSGDNASYSEIASSCREQFIRNGSLPSSNVKAADNTPLYLTLTGAYKSSAWSPINTEYTTFSQALDILSRVKSKGIDVITVRYDGVLKQNSTSFVGSLGSSKELEELYSYAISQNISLFTDVNILTYRSFSGKFDFSAAKHMSKSSAVAVNNESPDGKAENNIKYRFRKSKDVSDYVTDLIKNAEGKSGIGYCIGDAEYLISDYSADGVSRSDFKSNLSSQIPALANVGQVMVDKGNMYLIKNSCAVINIPMNVTYEESQSYVAIPFVQSVLHGRVTIAGTPVNTQQDMKKATLQCIEYGVCPSFSAVYNGENLENNVLFDNIVNDLVDCYNIAADALIGLESERITEHSQLKDGVYLTTYGDTAKVYVNYNDEAVTVNGVTVEAMSYLRID